MGAPISDFANTPFATVVARVARVVGDGSDSDRAPDFFPASGEIVFTPNIKFSKLEVDNKSVIVLNEPVRCTIDPVTGYMIGPDGGYGVRLVASSGVNIEPQGLGYTVTFRGAETRIPDFSIFLEAGSVVDLAKILPVDLQPGIVTTVSSKTVDAVEQALIRLNSLQENVSYTVKSIPDMFRWDGTTLLINGNPGPDLGRITDEKLEEVNNTIDSLTQAHSDLMNGYIEAQHSFEELDGKLGQAFPDNIFDVGAALGAVEVDVLAQAALEAQGMATAAQQAAITAAQDFAAGKISEAELRAANDAKAKADAARDAAIEAADLDATSKAGQALAGAQAYADAQAQAAVATAALEAQAKAEAAQEAAIQASAEHADLVAQGASADAIAAAALDAQVKADAAETAAKAHADAQATAAEVAAKTHATNEAARVKQEALTEAATDAQAKADAAAEAAEAAAKTYALAQAQGLSGQALEDAKADAKAKADDAEQAAKAYAKAYADARKNEAINAAALTAQTKADVAKQAAIDAAKADLDALQIGGRNLVRNSVINRTTAGYTLASMDFGERPPLDGETVTISIKGELGADRDRFAVYNSGGAVTVLPNIYHSDRGPDGVYRATLTWNTVSSTGVVADNTFMRIYQFPSSGVSTSTIEWVKLERGTKATDWTPAPEDVDSGIAGAIDALEVGGRNLIPNSNDFSDYVPYSGATREIETGFAVPEWGAQDATRLKFTKGTRERVTTPNLYARRNETVTFSYWLKVLGDNEISMSYNGLLGVVETTYGPGFEGRVVVTGTLRPDYDWFQHQFHTVDENDTIEFAIWRSQVERGSKATDWTPAPEDVEAGIDAAMTTADGKNTTSYKTVTTTPGAAPTAAVEGKNRRQFDMHRNRLSNGTIVGEWMWSGSSWVRVHMGDGVLRSLDVGKLTAGTANIETAVVNKLWGQLGVFDKLDVRTDAYVSGVNLKNGAVTARTLNVVPESGQGGLQLKSDGMMLIDSEGSGTVDLRVNSDNYLSFYRDGAVNFAVSDDGALSAQSVSANDGLFYRGVELTEFLESIPRGIVYYAEDITGTHTISNASYTSRIGHIMVKRPDTPRYWRIVARAGIQSSSTGGNVTSGVHWQFVSNTGSHYNQSAWTVLASVLYQTPGYYWQTETFEGIVNTDDIVWNSAGQALVSWTARNASGSSYKLGQGAKFYIEDMGPAFDRSPTYPWIRPSESTDSGSSTTPTTQTGTWNMSSFQNYLSGTRVNHASGNLAGGNYSGEWRGIMFFPHATIKSALSGATTTKVEIYLQNAHTYAYSGSTILIGSHNYASAPTSSPAVSARASQHFSRGQGRWVTLPNAVGDGFKAGTIKGLAVYGSSTANYATWKPSAPKLRITYKK